MDEESTQGTPAGLFRRLAALLYDALLLTALLFIVTLAMLPFSGGEAILTSTRGILGHLYHVLLLGVAFAYFGICWTRGGQTLGMKAWRIRLQTIDGRPPNWPDALVRFTIGATLGIMAALGWWYLQTPGWSLSDLAAGLLLLPALANLAWIRLNGTRQTLQDLAGQMRVRRLP